MNDRSDYIKFLEDISNMLCDIARKTCDSAVYINKHYYIKAGDITPDIANVIHKVNAKRFNLLLEDE